MSFIQFVGIVWIGLGCLSIFRSVKERKIAEKSLYQISNFWLGIIFILVGISVLILNLGGILLTSSPELWILIIVMSFLGYKQGTDPFLSFRKRF